MKIYFAGPDVFLPGLDTWRAKAIALANRLGIDPLLPCDGEESDFYAIRQSNIGMLTRCDGVVANLAAFRGAEVDTGTAFEVGYACALGKRVVGYVNTTETYEQRVDRLFGPLQRGIGVFAYRDRDGLGVEHFGAKTNLMISAGIPVMEGGLEAALEYLVAKRI